MQTAFDTCDCSGTYIAFITLTKSHPCSNWTHRHTLIKRQMQLGQTVASSYCTIKIATPGAWLEAFEKETRYHKVLYKPATPQLGGHHTTTVAQRHNLRKNTS
jgi:hypothetical protein